MHGAKLIKRGKRLITCHVCRGLQAFEAEPNLLHKHASEQFFFPSCPQIFHFTS
jgi:hypothetical protein